MTSKFYFRSSLSRHAVQKIFSIAGVALLLSTSATAQTESDTDDTLVLPKPQHRLVSAGACDDDNCAPSLGDPGTLSTSGSRSAVPTLSRAPQPSNHMVSEGPSASPVPDPPTEFQTFAEGSTGRSLPVFGSWLFDRVPSTFAPVDNIPVPPDHTIGPGDQIDLRIWGQINADQRLVVDRAGDIFIPQVGRVNVVGLQFAQLEGALRTSIGRVFRNFELSVNMGQLRSIQVFVMGHARRPGTYTVSSLSTLVNALFVSGGPSRQGSMRAIQLKRGGRVVTTFDMYDMLLRGDKTKDAALQPGDVIFIPQAGPQVAVSGSVENPAIYEMAANSSLREVLTYAGGTSALASGSHAVVERINAHSNLVSHNIDLDAQGLETIIEDGDIVKVQQIVQHFDKTVSLKGNVADPVRLPWHEGMKISELIPDKQALLTRNYWSEHDRLSAGSPGFNDRLKGLMDSPTLAASEVDAKPHLIRRFETKNDVQPPAAQINWNYASVERLDAQSLTTYVIPFNLGKVVLEHDAAADLTLEAGDVVTVFSDADFATPQMSQTRYIRLEGEIRMAGIYSAKPGETLRELVKRAGGLTDKAYLYATEFTRESTKREQQKRYNDYLDQMEQDLSQKSSSLAGHSVSADESTLMTSMLQNQRAEIQRLRSITPTGRIVLQFTPESQGVDSLPDIPLENGDRLIVPSRPVTVNVFGTVYNQSTFLCQDSGGVDAYLRQAGGATRYADEPRMFVIRADGSVLSRMHQSHFLSMPLFAGDTLVVPSNIAKVTKVRTLLDWSQVVSGFGIGAAAVNVLK